MGEGTAYTFQASPESCGVGTAHDGVYSNAGGIQKRSWDRKVSGVCGVSFERPRGRNKAERQEGLSEKRGFDLRSLCEPASRDQGVRGAEAWYGCRSARIVFSVSGMNPIVPQHAHKYGWDLRLTA